MILPLECSKDIIGIYQLYSIIFFPIRVVDMGWVVDNIELLERK